MRRWIAAGLWVVATLAIIDTGISLALTCHEQGYQPGGGQNPVADCSVFQGPIFRFLIWFANAFDKHGEAVIAVFTIVLALSTIGLWRSTRKLWEAGEKQIAVAAFSAQSSEQSARAAHRAAAIMDQTAERQLRAYVDIVSGQILNFGPGNIRLRIIVKNSGQTPAYKLNHWTAVGADDLPPKVGFAIPDPLGSTHRSTLAPGAFFTVLQEYGPLSADQVAKIQADNAAIWAWGQIEYTDAFGHDRKSWFRLLYSGAGTTEPPGGMRVDGDGNGAD